MIDPLPTLRGVEDAAYLAREARGRKALAWTTIRWKWRKKRSTNNAVKKKQNIFMDRITRSNTIMSVREDHRHKKWIYLLFPRPPIRVAIGASKRNKKKKEEKEERRGGRRKKRRKKRKRRNRREKKEKKEEKEKKRREEREKMEGKEKKKRGGTAREE